MITLTKTVVADYKISNKVELNKGSEAHISTLLFRGRQVCSVRVPNAKNKPESYRFRTSMRALISQQMECLINDAVEEYKFVTGRTRIAPAKRAEISSNIPEVARLRRILITL